MSKNPFLNALLALAYISVVASVIYYGPRLLQEHPDTVVLPIAFLSLFVLSASVTGYLFLYQPVQLYSEGAKQEALNLFLKTLLAFALLTAVVFLSVFLIAKKVIG